MYRGVLGDFTSAEPETCSTGQAAAWATPLTEGNAFYLVVPHNELNEGSYGLARSAGPSPVERSPSAFACLPQVIGECP